MTTIVWFRQDLRVADNPALAEAALRGDVLPVYILDETAPSLGGASKWWLHHSLAALEHDLGRLVVVRGDPRDLIPQIAKATNARAILWNRCYEPHAIQRDTDLKALLSKRHIDVRSFNSAVLHEPWDVATGSGGPYKVFSPFWRACLQRPVAEPVLRPKVILSKSGVSGEAAQPDWRLLPTNPDWASGWLKVWTPGAAGALNRLTEFLANGVIGYGIRRDRPDLANVSRLSPHLHWGEVSPRQVWSQTLHAADAGHIPRKDADKFLSEIGWREFSYHLLYHFPELPQKNWKPGFDAYPWRQSTRDLQAWQRGRTGYPFVDAGMRELWATGVMHNRVRMVAASFLIKHLRIDWRQGAAWFWDTLVDADLASNSASWQWVAGSGADAAPYFRIFNPTEQGRKFDPDGSYIRRWCPELSRLSDAHIHAPFETPAEILSKAGIILGSTYPHPIVEHRAAREAALTGYRAVQDAGSQLRTESD